MSLLSQWVFDPIKALATKVIASGEEALKDLAGKVLSGLASKLPATIPQSTVDSIEGGLQTLYDDALTGIASAIPGGAVVEGALKPELDAAFTALEAHGVSVLQSLFAEARAALIAEAAKV
jgi:hypothetical protein